MTIEQEQEMPLPPGSVVTLYENVDMDSDGGLAANVLFEGTVEQHVPQTGLLTFEGMTIQRAEFMNLVEQADGYQVITDK